MAVECKRSCSLWDTTNSLFFVCLLAKEVFACLYFGRCRLLVQAFCFVFGWVFFKH